MRQRKILGTALAALMIVTIIFVFAHAASAQKFKVLHVFDGKDGANPQGPLIFDAAGNLYGVTFNGGLSSGNCWDGSCGTVYELTPNGDGTWIHKVLHYFTGDEDSNPEMGVIFDAAGNLYGMTNGGPHSGNVYELTPQIGGDWSYGVLYQMGGAYDGNPGGGMIFDAAGNLYGTTEWGCGYGWGVACVFQMVPNGGSWTFNLLYGLDFMGSTGWFPNGTTPIFDAKGNLYATAELGGLGSSNCSSYGCGVVFELSPSQNGPWTLTDLHVFTGGVDGGDPICPLAFDAAGNLYGTTSLAGKYGYGNVFELSPTGDGTWKGQVLHQFTGGKDGGAPTAGVILDAAGKLYGTTTKGGAYGFGVVYRLTPTRSGGWKEAVIHAFRNNTSANPNYSNLILDAAGNLYGTVAGDDATTAGKVFEIMP